MWAAANRGDHRHKIRLTLLCHITTFEFAKIDIDGQCHEVSNAIEFRCPSADPGRRFSSAAKAQI